MSSKRIEITVDAEGNSSINAVGFTGMGCIRSTEFLEKALGEQGVRQRKPAFYRSEQTQNHQVLGHQNP